MTLTRENIALTLRLTQEDKKESLLVAALLAAWDERDAVNGILLRSMDQVKTLHRAEAAEAKLAERDAENARLRDALEWYDNPSSQGDVARAALNKEPLR